MGRTACAEPHYLYKGDLYLSESGMLTLLVTYFGTLEGILKNEIPKMYKEAA